MRKGFTFIEVMIAVVIISVVITALLEIYANNTYIFSKLEKKSETNQHLSFVISNPDYGLENKNTSLYELLKDFELDDSLRRQLKSVKVNLTYQKLEKIDMNEYESEEQEGSNSKMIFEIGKTILKVDEDSASIIRIKLQ